MKIEDFIKEKFKSPENPDKKISNSEGKKKFILLAVVVIVFGLIIGFYSRSLSNGTVSHAIESEESTKKNSSK